MYKRQESLLSSMSPELKAVSYKAPIHNILKALRKDGAVILRGLLTPLQVARMNSEIEPRLDATYPGTTHSDPFRIAFHGSNTKRLDNLVTHSRIFERQLLDNDTLHKIADACFREECGAYWLNVAEVIEIGPRSPAQPLHRDLDNYLPFIDIGPSGPEVALNFIVALTDFTDQNGATRIIPGSHRWPNFHDRGNAIMTIPATMKAGDALLMSGKTVHGGGCNETSFDYRRALALTFSPSYLTPETAYPFIVDKALAKQLSHRSQQMLGFRSQYLKGSWGTWEVDCKDISEIL